MQKNIVDEIKQSKIILDLSDSSNIATEDGDIRSEIMEALNQKKGRLLLLVLDSTNIGNKGVAKIAKLNLRAVSLNNNPKINDLGIATLAASNFSELYLKNTSLTDKGVIDLVKSKYIKDLVLNGSNIGNESAYAIAKNESIQTVSLCETNVDDKGAIALSRNKNIRVVRLDYTSITIVGFKALKQQILNGGRYSLLSNYFMNAYYAAKFFKSQSKINQRICFEILKFLSPLNNSGTIHLMRKEQSLSKQINTGLKYPVHSDSFINENCFPYNTSGNRNQSINEKSNESDNELDGEDNKRLLCNDCTIL